MILSIIIFLIAIKLYLMKKSLKEIHITLNKIIQTNTNQLLTISSSDRDIKKLTNGLKKK